MSTHMCPRETPRHWSPTDVLEVTCDACGETLEFFMDDKTRPCPGCGARVLNPNLPEEPGQ